MLPREETESLLALFNEKKPTAIRLGSGSFHAKSGSSGEFGFVILGETRLPPI